MVRASPIQTNYTGGEVSPLLWGYVNLERFADSARLIQNLLVLKQGPLTRRGGTVFIKEVKNSAHNTVLIPFIFSDTDAFQLELGNQYMRFFRNYGVVTLTPQNITNITQANPAVVTYSGSDTYANGDEVFITAVTGMTQINNKFYRVANVNAGANTFQLQSTDGININSSSFTAYTAGGTIAEVYEITTPYLHTDLVNNYGGKNFQTTQSADVLYIAHRSYAVRSVTRATNTSWSISELDLLDGPYLSINTTATTLGLSGTSGSVTVTASAITGINNDTGFQTTDVGRLIRWRDPANNWTWLEITARTSTTQVTATIRGANASATTATVNWRLGVYSDTTGHPRAIGFHQDRLVLAGNTEYPDRYDLSVTGGYTTTTADFKPSAADGTVTDDNAIFGNLPDGRINEIQWIATDERGMVMGTTSGEWVLKSSNNNEVLTPDTAKATPVSSIGSAYIQPIQAESAVLFVQTARRRTHELVYNFQLDRLKPRDVNILSEHITRTQVTNMVYQQEPLNMIWQTRGDGVLLGMTYYPDQGLFGWARHVIGGTNSLCKDVSCIPSTDASRSDLWLIQQRTINGTTRKYIEYMARFYEDDIAKEDAVCVDSALVYSGALTTTISGLEHLEGQTVKVLRNGRAHPDVVVTGGAITLNTGATKAVIGLGNAWVFQSQSYEAGSQTGTSQGKIKRIISFAVRLLNTLGFRYGADANTLDEYTFNQGDSYDEDLPLFSGETPSLAWPGSNQQDATVYLTDSGVFPVTICNIMPEMVTYDRG